MAAKIITINRMYGSNGRKLGQMLAEQLGIHYYDKELLRIISEKKGVPYEKLLKVDEKRASQWNYPINDNVLMSPQYRYQPMNDVLFESESRVIQELSKNEDCIIIGRCANRVLKGKCRSVFIHAPVEARVATVIERLGRTEQSARSMIRKIDKERRLYYNFFTEENWTDMTQYDLCIDSSSFSLQQAVDLMKILYETL